MEDNRPGTGRPMTSQSTTDNQIGSASGTGSAGVMMNPAQRPTSRRKFGEAMTAKARPDSRMSGIGGGGGEAQRPMSRIARLQSAVRPGSSFRQGSALRTATARPPSGITAGSLPMHASVNVLDRPVTQQGVSGLRTARTSQGNRRMIHDKTYFLGLLHTKMSEMGAEIGKLNTTAEALAKEQSTYIAYENRVKEKAAELNDLHGELADYNILMDMLASDKDKFYLEEELKTLKRENQQESDRIETIYNRRRDSEKQVAELEQKIEQEKHKAEQLLESLSPTLKDRYEAFSRLNTELQQEIESLQFTLDELNSRKSELYDRISRSELKKKAAQLEEELMEAEEKREALARDSQSQETPEQERERLLVQVKADNSDINTLERQLTEISEQIRQSQDELRNMEQEIEENDSDRQNKFRELKKREQDMEEFMRAFEDNKAKELENLNRLENDIMNIAEKIARNSHMAQTLPETGQGFMELREDLDFKEDEFDRAKYTTEMIEYRNESLKKQLENFENLDEKMKAELKSLDERISVLQTDIKKYQDTDSLKEAAADRNQRLQQESVWLEQKTKKLSDMVRIVQAEHDKYKNELENNEVHRQLSSLEKKWVALEQTNYGLMSFLQLKKSETDYEGIKGQALTVLKDLNNMLMIK